MMSLDFVRRLFMNNRYAPAPVAAKKMLYCARLRHRSLDRANGEFGV
jgi:hypothetical protein